MLKQIEMLEKAAWVLSRLEKKIVFVGGSTIPLYLDSVAAEESRATKDVDCVVEIASTLNYYQLSEELRSLGLEEDSQSSVICRWLYDDLIIDIMPTDPRALGFSNRWYEPGFRSAITHILPNGYQINVFPVTYVLASKIEAFMSRGNGDFYWSHDFEDIILLLDGCDFLIGDFQQTDVQVTNFVSGWFKYHLDNLIQVAPELLTSSSGFGRKGHLIQTIKTIARQF